MSTQSRIRLCTLSAAVMSACVTMGAAAQDAKLERIEITGSNIKRADSEGVTPIQVISREEIQKQGVATVSDLLRNLSSNSGQSYNETFTNSFSPGAAGVGLRGLSQKNTLTLINGRRVANYGFAQNLQDTYVDINAIPASAVERIEVLKDGASAIYGSDAIAGVINVILRKDFKGIGVGASAGKSTAGKMNEYNLNGTYGIGDIGADRYNLMVSANFFKRDPVYFTDRDYTRQQDFRSQDDGLFAWGNARTYRVTPRQAFAGCGNGNPGVRLPGSLLATSGVVCAYNPAPFLTLVPETQRSQLVANGTVQLTSSLQAFANVLYSKNETKQRFTPAALSQTSVAYDPATGGIRSVSNILPVGNPSNPFATATGINYTFFEVGGRDAKITTDFYRALAGLKGTAGTWDWEGAIGNSKSKTAQLNYNRVNAFTLNAERLDGSYNFNDPLSTPAALAALRIDPRRDGTSKLDFIDAKATTELATLPAGPLGFAAGAEWRRESILDKPDSLLTSGAVLGQGSTGTDGSRRNWAVYGEFNVPIVKTLEAQLALRHDKYSDFGSATSPKAGLRFQPMQELLLRASYAKGFRAPSLPENSPASATFFTTVTDPDDPSGRGSQTTAGVFKSNADLTAEKSNSYNFSVLLSPDKDSSIELAYYRISQKNIVSTNGFNFILQNPALFGTCTTPTPGCAILRNAAGELVAVYDQYRNLSILKTRGVDIEMKKVVRTGVGSFTGDVSATYLIDYQQPLAAGEEPTKLAGNNIYTALPRLRGYASLTWDHGVWSNRIGINYIDGYDQSLGGTQQRVASQSTYDLYADYTGFKNTKIFASIVNVFGRKPPYDAFYGQAYGIPFDFTLYDARGRFFRVGVDYKF